ncbi:MAG TPA: MASE1 domain-containing protein, partial [Ilumatobacteraceae bacterium]
MIRVAAAPFAPADRIARAGNLAVFVTVALAYAVLALAAYELFGAMTIGVTFFPPAGLTYAALVMLPIRRWPAVVAAIVVAEIAVDLVEGQPFSFTMGWALANSVEPVVAALVTRRIVHRIAFNVRFAIAFLVGGLLAGPAVGGAIGATNLAIEHDHPWFDAWADAWIGDALGVLVVAPLVFVLGGSIRRLRPDVRRQELWLLLFALMVLVVAFWVSDDAAVGYVAIPLLVWAALRQGPLGLAVVGFVTAAAATTATAHDRGPWGSDPSVDAADRLRQQQAFVLVAIGGAWVLALEVRRRLAAVQQAIDARADLETALERARLVDEVRRERDQAATLQAFTASLTGVSRVEDVEEVTSRYAKALVERAELQLELTDSDALGEEQWTEGFAALPVLGPGGAFGTLTVRFSDGAVDDDSTRTAIRVIAQLVGQALERARLHEEERARRVLLVAINEMLAALGGVTTSPGVAAAVERHGREALDADAVVLALRDDDEVLVVRAVSGQHPVRVGEPLDSDDDALATAVRTGRATFIDGHDADVPSSAVVPLSVGGRTLGVLWFTRSEPWPDPLRLHALSFASFVADALGRARNAQADHEAALALQKSLMPRRTPRVDRARVAGR